MSHLIAVLIFMAGAGMSSRTPEGPVQAWWVDPLKQVLADATIPDPTLEGRIDAARGEVEAIQVAVRSENPCRVTVEAAEFTQGMPIRVRQVQYVPIVRGTHHTPADQRVAVPPVDLPDPLVPGNSQDLTAGRTACFWLDVEVPRDTKPGQYQTTISINADGTSIELPLALHVHTAMIPFECHLLLTNWFSVRPKELGFGDAPAGSDAWFAAANVMFDSMWAHRQNMFWTPLAPPWIQPTVTEAGTLDFDFKLFDAWVEAFSKPRGGSRKTYIEGQPIATRQGYDGHVQARVWQVVNGKPEQVTIEATDPAAREGYRIFLTVLRQHLIDKGWLDRFRIHITDEPHGHQLKPYAVFAGYVREFAPEFLIMEALDVRDEFEFFEQNCDVWVPQLGRFNQSLDRMLERLAQGKETWIYTCLFPNGAYPNRFVDYPLIKTRMLHWMNFRWGFTGYLHWGFNHWRGDPFQDLEPPHGGSTFLPPGDAWIVYPGDHQLLDSIRHEAMRDGVEDFELLTLLAHKNPEQAHELAAAMVRSFTDYVRDEKEFRAIRMRLLDALD